MSLLKIGNGTKKRKLGHVKDHNMAGSAGHILSPWENTDLTFGQIREIITRACYGTLENPSEKLDGQNIMATYKNGHVYIARTPKQVRNNGAEAIRWDLVGDYMKTPESKESYATAAQDLQLIFVPIEEKILQNFFCDGKYWLNMELLTPLMENIIHYGKSQLRIHNVQTEGKIVDRNLDEFLELIKDAQNGAKTTFDVDKTNKVSFSVIDPSLFLNELDDLMYERNLVEGNTLKDFLAIEFEEFIDFEFNMYNEEDPGLRRGLIQRWAYFDKSRNITKLLVGVNSRLATWVREVDSTIEETRTEFLEIIIELLSKVGVKILQNLKDIACSNPEESKKIISNKAETGINKLKEYKGEKSENLRIQYDRFIRAGGWDSIVPVEGIVFKFEGNLFKLTGSYLPLLKIISFFRFGRDK
jgi:hypothetical protein